MDVCTTEQLCSLLAQTEQEYSTERMAEVLAKLLEALAERSPQIYEKFREIQDLLRRAAAVFTKKEQIVMAQFPAPHIKIPPDNVADRILFFRNPGRVLFQ